MENYGRKRQTGRAERAGDRTLAPRDNVEGKRPDAKGCKEMAPHSSVLAWRIPGTWEPGGLPSMGLHRVGHD